VSVPGALYTDSAGTLQQRCQRTRSALVRRVPPLASPMSHRRGMAHQSTSALTHGEAANAWATLPSSPVRGSWRAWLNRWVGSVRCGWVADGPTSSEPGNSNTTRSCRSDVCSGT